MTTADKAAPAPFDASTLVRRLVVALLLMVVLYGAYVAYTGAEKIGAQLRTFSWGTFGLALGLVLGNYFLRFLKWEYYLGRLGIRGVPKVQSLLVFLSGFVLTVTPGKVGEVFKSYVLAETQGVPMPKTAPIVVAERLTDVIGVVVLVLVGSTTFPGGRIWAIAGAAAVVVGLLVIGSEGLAKRVLAALAARGGKLAALAPRLAIAWESLRAMTTPRHLIVPAFLSVASWALEGVALHVILGGLGQSPPVTLSLFVYATSTLAGALIPVPGGLGITEGMLGQQLARFGNVEMAASATATILTRFATLWFAVVLGFVALAILRAQHPHLLSSREEPLPKPLERLS